MACKKEHENVQSIMEELSLDQGGVGRHKCAACAYERGYQDGLQRKENIDLTSVIDSLEESQAKAQRHKSPHEAWARGYQDGIKDSYK